MAHKSEKAGQGDVLSKKTSQGTDLKCLYTKRADVKRQTGGWIEPYSNTSAELKVTISFVFHSCQNLIFVNL